MKSLTHYIQEKLIIKKNKRIDYKYFPQKKLELEKIIRERLKEEGNNVDLNDIDTSNITDMSKLFPGFSPDFNGDISEWDVSNVEDMYSMFYDCKNFNQDISRWVVSKITDMGSLFYGCKSFNQDISNWDVSSVTNMYRMFYGCPIEEKYKPKFK